jgi:ankyrin repeat protein
MKPVPRALNPFHVGRFLFGLATLAVGSGAIAQAAEAKSAAKEYATIDEAIARGDVEGVKRHLERDPSVIRGEGGTKLSPLHQAILRRQTKIAVVLLEAGADVQVPDTADRTPLHLAVERAEAGIVQELLRRKADPTKRDRVGWTPLHHAAAKNRLEIAALLLDAGMDPNFLSALGGTALHEAAAGGSVEMVKLLLARGVDPTIRSKPGVTALDLAREYKHPEVVAVLEAVKPKR